MPESLTEYLRHLSDDYAVSCRDKHAKRLRECAAWIEELEAKLSPPWLDAPDGEGWWWNDRMKTPYRIIDKGDHLAVYLDLRNYAIGSFPGRWSRAIIPQEPTNA